MCVCILFASLSLSLSSGCLLSVQYEPEYNIYEKGYTAAECTEWVQKLKDGETIDEDGQHVYTRIAWCIASKLVLCDSPKQAIAWMISLYRTPGANGCVHRAAEQRVCMMVVVGVVCLL